MEAKKIKNIITAIGNPILNNELKKIEKFNILNNDILYQEGILETLDFNEKIDFLILSQLLPGQFNLENLIEEIKQKNEKIKIIIILEKVNNELETILNKQGVYRIIYNNKIEIKDIIKIINEDEKMEKYNEEIRKEIDELKKYILNNNYYEKNIFNKKIKNKIKNKTKNINNKINNINFDNKNLNENINKNNNINSNINNYKNNNSKKYKNNKIINIKNNLLNNKIIKFLKNKLIIIFNIINNKKIIKKIKINSEKSEKNKIISILGNSGSGKSVISVMLANYCKKFYNKILIIDFDILNNSLHTILGVNKYSEKIKNIMRENNFNNILLNNFEINNNLKKQEINIENLIIKINKKIDLISGINLLFDKKGKINEEKIKELIKILSSKYEKIIIDTSSECFFEYTKELMKISNSNIFLTEANLVELSKSKRILDIYHNNWNIEKNKIKIIFNKFNEKSININLLKNLYCDYEILGKIKIDNIYNSLINNNFKNYLNINKKIKKNNNIFEKISA